MNYLYILAFTLISGISWSQNKEQQEAGPESFEPEPVATPVVEKQGPYTVVDLQAEYPGGIAALRRFLAENIQYPQTAVDNDIQGKCYLKFTILANGTIADISVLRGVPDCPECDQESIRVVKLMPKWKPGKVNGKAVDSFYNLPIAFYTQ